MARPPHPSEPAFVVAPPGGPDFDAGQTTARRRRPPRRRGSVLPWLLVVALAAGAAGAAVWGVVPLRHRLQVTQEALVEANSGVGTLQRQVEVLAAARRNLEEAQAATAQQLAEQGADQQAVQGVEEALARRLAAEVEAGALEVGRVEGHLALVLLAPDVFAAGEAGLSGRGRALLAAVVAGLAPLAEYVLEVRVYHDAARPESKVRGASGAWDAATRRAAAAAELVQASGHVAAAHLAAAAYLVSPPATGTAPGPRRGGRLEVIVLPPAGRAGGGP